MAAEGPHLFEESLDSAWKVDRILVTPPARLKFSSLLTPFESEVIEVSENAFASVATTEHSQGIMALLHPRVWTWAELLKQPALLMIFDGLQDPGNTGTLVRSAEAFGGTGVIFGRASVHVANPKFLRATAGSIFRLPFVSEGTAVNVLENLEPHGIQAYALAANGTRSIHDLDLRQPCAFVTGAEGAGISEEWGTRLTTVRIPAVKVESLNAAVAGSLALSESFRQRSSL